MCDQVWRIFKFGTWHRHRGFKNNRESDWRCSLVSVTIVTLNQDYLFHYKTEVFPLQFSVFQYFIQKKLKGDWTVSNTSSKEHPHDISILSSMVYQCILSAHVKVANRKHLCPNFLGLALIQQLFVWGKDVGGGAEAENLTVGILEQVSILIVASFLFLLFDTNFWINWGLKRLAGLFLSGCRVQRPKNPYSKLALLSGKILRVRKIFARMRKKLF